MSFNILGERASQALLVIWIRNWARDCERLATRSERATTRENKNKTKKTIQHGEIESLGISAIREFETQQQQIDQSETKRRLGNWKWQLFQFKWIIVDTGRGVVAKRTGDTTSAASYVRFMFPYRCPWLIDGVHEHVQNRCTVTTFLLSPR